jgi:hypothetical protein
MLFAYMLYPSIKDFISANKFAGKVTEEVI